QLTARGNYQRTERENSGTVVGSGGGIGGGTTTTTTGASKNFWQARVDLTQLVWDFGQTTGRYHSAEYLASAQESTQQVTLRQVLLNVRTNYFAAVADKALVQVQRDTLENQQRHLDQVQAFIQVGTRPEIDLAQSKTDVASARLALIRAENAYATGRAV